MKDYDAKECSQGRVTDNRIIFIEINKHDNWIKGWPSVDFDSIMNHIFRASSFTNIVFRIVHSYIKRSWSDCKQTPKGKSAVLKRVKGD